jgi:hypothetical protein
MSIAADLMPSEAAVRAANDICYESIVEACELTASYASSAREAAWRGDYHILEAHLRQLRLTVIFSLNAFRAIATVGDETSTKSSVSSGVKEDAV